MLLLVATKQGNVFVKIEGNRYHVSLPYGRFDATVFTYETRDSAFTAAASYLAS